MIVSHRLRTVFVHTRKCAGTSIEIALSRHCGPRDVIVRLTDAEEAVRRQVGGRTPRRYLARAWDLALWRSALGKKPRPAGFGKLREDSPKVASKLQRQTPRRFDHHTSAGEVIGRLGRARWDDYFTWTVERNPWDKAVSRYYWEKARRVSMPGFSEFLRICPAHLLSSWGLYTVDDRVVVDRVLRFERLAEELGEVWERLGIDEPPMLVREKGSHRPPGDWRSMFSDDDVELVAGVCSKEIQAFGYTF